MSSGGMMQGWEEKQVSFYTTLTHQVFWDLSLTLAVRSKLPLSDDPRLILCLTFSNSSHRKKLDFKCSLSRWTYWGGNLCPESAMRCCCCCRIFFSLISAEKHSYQSVTGNSSVSGTTLFYFIPRPFKLDRKTWWVHLKVALSVCLCVSDVCTFLHKRVRYDLHGCK